MANKQGISTAKGFQEKVPFAEQADSANYATTAYMDNSGNVLDKSHVHCINGGATVTVGGSKVVFATVDTSFSIEDIISVGFKVNGFHLATTAGGSQNGIHEFDCIGMRAALLKIMGARVYITLSDKEFSIRVDDLVEYSITSDSSMSYSGQSVAIEDIKIICQPKMQQK